MKRTKEGKAEDIRPPAALTAALLTANHSPSEKTVLRGFLSVALETSVVLSACAEGNSKSLRSKFIQITFLIDLQMILSIDHLIGKICCHKSLSSRGS